MISSCRSQWLAVLLTAPLNLFAADPDRGRLLYENHCSGCHDSLVHIRENRRATSLDDVRGWVGRWQGTLVLEWNREERDAVSVFLYKRFYSSAE